MANLYEPRMRNIRNDSSIMDKELDAASSVKAWIRETTTKMANTKLFTPTEIVDIMEQWFNASIRTIIHDELPNEAYPLYKEIDSTMDGFLIKGEYYNLFNNGELIQIFGEDKNIRVEPAQIVARNGLVDIRIKNPNVTLYFALRSNYEEYHLKYELYKILQNLW